MLYTWFQALLTGCVMFFHPLYVSMIDIQHKPNEKLVEISVRIFTDDLEKTLRKTNDNVDLTNGNRNRNDHMIEDYIAKTLHLRLDGREGNMQYVGYEQQLESTWCYFEIRQVPAVKKIDVTCNLLYDFQSIQMNIFHVKVNGAEKSYKLDNPKTKASFDF